MSRRKCWSLPSGTSQGPAQRDRAAEEPKRRGRPKSSGTGLVARVKGTDYTEMDNIGLVHRGRITDKEKELVAANFGGHRKTVGVRTTRDRPGQPEGCGEVRVAGSR